MYVILNFKKNQFKAQNKDWFVEVDVLLFVQVQLAKLAGCHVIGTCSSDEKISFLKSIGCDRPIDYKKEDLQTVLSKEYPVSPSYVFYCIVQSLFSQ